MDDWLEELQRKHNKKAFHVNLEALGIIKSKESETTEQFIERIERKLGRRLSFQERIAITPIDELKKKFEER